MVVKIWRLGLTSYDTAYKIQHTLARRHLDAMMKGIDANCDTILLVEHKPVYTVGIRDETTDVHINKLKALGAEFKKTNRGGLITFHGPGQLIAYPIINLKHFKTSVKWYVNSLEETIIRMCAKLGINATRSENTGVWVDDSKLAAIGIHATRYVTSHGVAINCDNDLSWFDYIDPCGFNDKGVTSISLETGTEYPVSKIEPLFIKSFEKVFSCQTEDMSAQEQEDILNRVYNKMLVNSETCAGEAMNKMNSIKSLYSASSVTSN